jgi:HK97 family phage portal protein
MFGLTKRASAPERRDWATPSTVDMIHAALRRGSYSGPTVAAGIRSLPAVSRGLQLTAGVASMMPVDEMQKRGEESVPVARSSQLLREPSALVPFEDWVWQHLDSMIVHGDAWGRIVARDANLRATQVELCDPAEVSVRTVDRGRSMEVRFAGEIVPEEHIWHVAGRPRSAGPLGRGLLDVASDILAVGLSGREWARAFFEDGGAPVVVARQTAAAPGGMNLDDGERAKAIKDRIMSAIRGNRDPLLLPGWLELDKWPAVNPTEAALVEVLRANNTDVAHHIGVPPELVGGVTGDSMTYANIEARMIDLLVFGVDYWLMKLEKKLTRECGGPNRFVKFNRAAVLRADQKAVAETLGLLVRSGLMTQNEARDKLDRPRIDGADVLLWPPMTTSQPPTAEGAP